MMRSFLVSLLLLPLSALACSDDTSSTTTTGAGGAGSGGSGTTTSSTTTSSAGGAGTGGGNLSCPGGAPGCVEDWAGQFGQMGTTDGVGQAARFQNAAGITSIGGFLYVTDNHAIRRIEIATATVTTFAGLPGTAAHVDAIGGAARFSGPSGITTDGTDLYVSDAGNAVVRKIVVSTGAVTTLTGLVGTTGNVDGASSVATFDNMRELEHDGTFLYLVEAGTASVLRRIDPTNGAVLTLAGTYNTQSFADGTGTAALFSAPRHVVATAANTLYVADTENNRPRLVNVVSNQGVVTSPYGSSQGYLDGTGVAAQFNRLRGLAFDGTGLIVADSDNFCIRHIDLQTNVVTTLAGTAQVQGHAVGIGTAASIDKPLDLHFDPITGDVFIIEGANIRRFYYQ